jgi:pimeloyl-ACP methyl ester carboxylesterase
MPTFVGSSGIRLHYEDDGVGQPLLFLHGCWCSSAFFDSQARDLSSRYRVLRLDFRGHGQSAGVQEGLTVGVYAEDLHEFLTRLAITPVVVGWSMGALVIWEYHQLFRTEKILGAVVVDQSASDFRRPDWPLGFAGLDELRVLMERVQVEREALVGEIVDAMFATPASPETRSWAVTELLRPSAAAAASILFDQTLRDYRHTLQDFTTSTLVCFGRDEKIMPVALGRHLVDNMPNATLEIFENSGHCPFLEETEAFNKRLTEFVDALRP